MTATAIAPKAPESATPDAQQFAAIVGKYLADKSAAKDLHLLLTHLDIERATYADRLAWMEELASWMHVGSNDARTRRLQAFVRALATVRVYRESFAALLTAIVTELRGTKLFAEVGIPNEPGFWREMIDRLSRRFLPAPPVPKSFQDFISAIFPTKREASFIEHSPAETWRKLWGVIEITKSPLSSAWMPLAASMSDAMRIIAARIAALGVAQDVRDRLPEMSIASLPFLRLPTLCETVQIGPPRLSVSNEGALAMIEECRAALRLVHAHVEEYGVSVDLVYRLELMAAQLTRLEQLVSLLVPASQEALAQNLGRFARDLVRAQFQNRSIFELLGRNSHVLAKKVVERSGLSGEHYITKTRKEWRAMLFSAAGGGFLTCFTAAFKILSGKLHVSLLTSSTLNIINYAGSFLLMGALGYTLATKQPSMTAAALATSLETENEDPNSGVLSGREPHLDRLVTIIAQISRSQLAAAMGNVGMVIPVALLFEFIWRRATGHSFLDQAKAVKVVDSLHPLKGGMLPYAAFTGVLLWASSIAAGWFENWVIYRRLPEAIAKHRRIRRFLGPERAKRWADALEHGATSAAGSVSLGFLLGFMPAMGTLFGLPIDVRHVTLSTGSLVFAGSALGTGALGTYDFLGAAVGILFIGTLNFGVSFVLALAVALRARDRWRAGTVSVMNDLIVALVRRFFRTPTVFFFPPKNVETASIAPSAPPSIPPPPPSSTDTLGTFR